MLNSISRRSMLSLCMAAGVTTMIEPALAARQRPLFFQKRGLPVGLQVYTLGEDAGKDVHATFTQIAAIGYREIELPGLYGRKPAELRDAADKAGLKITSVHLPVAAWGPGPALTIANSSSEIAESLGILGAERGVLPLALLPDTFKPQAGEDIPTAIGRAFATGGADPWHRTAALLNKKAAELKPMGVKLGYHNHNLEFLPTGSTNGWEILVKETDPALIQFEIDIGWVVAAGRNPVDFLREHRGRVVQMHVKDVAAGNVANDTLGMKPAEIGSGTLDWAAILPVAYDAGVRHFYVEQEPPFTIPRIEAARKSYQFLSQLRA